MQVSSESKNMGRLGASRSKRMQDILCVTDAYVLARHSKVCVNDTYSIAAHVPDAALSRGTGQPQA